MTNTSLTWVPNSIFQLGLPNEMALGLDDEANYGFDTVTLGWQGSGGPSVQHSTIANMAYYEFWLGTFGLNPQPANFTTYTDPQPSFMTQLKRNNTIPSLSWGYTAGNQYRESINILRMMLWRVLMSGRLLRGLWKSCTWWL